MTKIINTQEFNDFITGGKETAVVDFYADWCGPCKMLGPVIEQLEQEYSDKCKFYKINIDKDGALAAGFGIMSIPTVVFYKDGKEQKRSVGLASKGELADIIKTL